MLHVLASCSFGRQCGWPFVVSLLGYDEVVRSSLEGKLMVGLIPILKESPTTAGWQSGQEMFLIRKMQVFHSAINAGTWVATKQMRKNTIALRVSNVVAPLIVFPSLGCMPSLLTLVVTPNSTAVSSKWKKWSRKGVWLLDPNGVKRKFFPHMASWVHDNEEGHMVRQSGIVTLALIVSHANLFILLLF
jgi:hypothetical protein